MKQGHDEANIGGESGEIRSFRVEQHETCGGLLLKDEEDVRRLGELILAKVPFFDVATREQLSRLQERADKGEVLSEGYQSNEWEIGQQALLVEEHELARERYTRAWYPGYPERVIDALKELEETGRVSIRDSMPYAPGLNVWKTGDSEHPYAARLVRSHGFDASNTFERKVAEELGFARGVALIDIRANILEKPYIYNIATLLGRLSYSNLAPVAQTQSGCLGPLGRLMNRGSEGEYTPEDIATSLASNARSSFSQESLPLGVKDGFVISLKLLGGRDAVSDGATLRFSDREPVAGFVITLQGYEKLGKDSWNISSLFTSEQIEAARQLADNITRALSE